MSEGQSVEGQSFFARTRPIPRPEHFAIAAVRPSEREMAFRIAGTTSGFSAVLDVGTEITLLLPQERWAQVSPVFLDPAVQVDYRVVTLEADVDLDAVGYISTVTGALARAGLAVGVVSAFSCDHLLVRDRDLRQCLEILQKAGAAAPGRA